MESVFIGSEAVAAGEVTRAELRKYHRRVLPDVYGPRRGALSLSERTAAAWLWSRREGVVAGLAASAALGAKWVDAGSAIELVWSNNRPPPGVLTSRDTLLADEVSRVAGIPVTSAERTAFDLARRGTVRQAVARLDALARATHVKTADVQALANRHPHVKGLRRVDPVLDLVDPGAESPKETWLRLLLIEAGFPRPQTQIPVLAPDGYPLYYLDMGWEDMMIAVEYDGDDHRERPRFGKDLIRSEYVVRVGWTHIRVVNDHRRSDIVRRVGHAWSLRER